MNSDKDLLKQLSARLRGEIPGWTAPGWDAQQLMATEVHRNARLQPRSDARRAAVLMLLYPHNGQIYLPLIVRPVYPGVHSGQIALPGGKVEPEDASLVATALRETEEEIGVRVPEAQVLGELSELYIPPSNMRVTPVVAYVQKQPTYTPDLREVVQVLDFSLEAFADPENQTVVSVAAGKTILDAPGFVIEERIIWGATAMMMSELLEVLDTNF
ncbi:MAG: CoA pyrophosphatase [Tunicatimonas sp.]